MSSELFPEFPILIVDDDKNFVNSIEATLFSNQITNFDHCMDGLNVLGKLKEKKYSLILLDLRMPNISGEELLSQLNENYPEIPVIILTGFGGIPEAIECIKNGAFYFLKKTDTNQLIKKVGDGLDETRKKEPVTFIGPLPTLAQLEVRYFKEIMKKAGGNLSLAAQIAGMDEETFANKVKDL